MSLNRYWAGVDESVRRAKTAKTVAEVLALLEVQTDLPEHSGRAFFGGDGVDLLDALYEAGWTMFRYGAAYYWVLRSPDGSELISYTEGDVDPGDNPACGT